jgi:hypothetical protein
MFLRIVFATTMLAAGISVGCGVSSTEPNGGSKAQSSTGVSSSGYPAGDPQDAGSPALASSTESKYSRDQEVKDEPGK